MGDVALAKFTEFQHTAARRRLDHKNQDKGRCNLCFNTQPPEGGWVHHNFQRCTFVSFNTQPPEGGWKFSTSGAIICDSFNTQPPEGGWR